MKLEICSFKKGEGWREPLPSEMDSAQTLVLVFGSSGFAEEHQPWQDLRAAFTKSNVVGCSTSGEIIDCLIQDDSIVCAIAQFEKSYLLAAAIPISDSNYSSLVGGLIAEELTKPGLRAILLLSDGLNVNGSELVAGVNSFLPPGVIVTGGLAGDGDRFKKTWVLDGFVPKSNVVSAVGFYGEDIRINHGSKGGWDIFGPERRVTKSAGNQLFELDKKPALQLYKNYLGDMAADLPASALLFPLAVRTGQPGSSQVVRTILGIDEEKQSMTFAGDIPLGSFVQLMRANFDRLIDGASEAAEMAMGRKAGPQGMLSLAISCVGRRLILGERAEEELEAVFDVLPEGARQIGFYSYGELSPSGLGRCELHNQTMTLTTISED